jgi:hypothetical protein
MNKPMKEFINDLFSHCIDEKGLEKINSVIRAQVARNAFDYNNMFIETQILTNENNYDCEIDVNHENYPDGEIFFLDIRPIQNEKFENNIKGE